MGACPYGARSVVQDLGGCRSNEKSTAASKTPSGHHDQVRAHLFRYVCYCFGDCSRVYTSMTCYIGEVFLLKSLKSNVLLSFQILETPISSDGRTNLLCAVPGGEPRHYVEQS